MMKDPKFAQMFGSAGSPFSGTNAFTGNASSQSKTNSDGSVDAEVVD